jgi:hypothetical protein
MKRYTDLLPHTKNKQIYIIKKKRKKGMPRLHMMCSKRVWFEKLPVIRSVWLCTYALYMNLLHRE